MVFALGLTILPAVLPAQAGRNPGVIPPNAKPHGLTYGEWSARWWQWAYSLPVPDNPFFDVDGDCTHGANEQSGHVWFLTGVINLSGTAVRDCTVPAGQMLFFPILNVECATLEGNGSTEAELRACTDFFMSFVTNVAAELDGRPIQNFQQRYRAASPLFTYGPLPDDNVLQLFGFDPLRVQLVCPPPMDSISCWPRSPLATNPPPYRDVRRPHQLHPGHHL
jgi:hypothetical protein